MKPFPGRALVVGAAAFSLALPGCASWRTDQETVVICQRGFTNDVEWERASRLNRSARALWKKAPDIEFEGKTSQPAKATTIWFRNSGSAGFASCSRHSCDTGRCLWRVRLYSKVEERWRLRLEYDLGRPRR